MRPGFVGRTIDGLGLLFGRQPTKPAPEQFTEEARAMHVFKKTPEERKRRKEAIREELDHPQASNKWRIRRWISILVLNGIFIASYWSDLQLVEGALTASRVLGFHFADLNSSLQLMLAHKHVVINLLIGITTVLLIYLALGGRTFCSWVCPYHLLSEIAEKLHLKLVEKRWVKDHPLDRRLRTVMFGVFAALAFVTGYTLFETISPVGILSRFLTYGTGIGLIWIGALLVIEVFWSRRMWCRYLCPIGLTYGMVGTVTPVRVVHDVTFCFHEGKCRDVCLVPHVLDMTKLGYASEVRTPIGPDCTRCGMCLDVCPTGALRFDVKGITKVEQPAE